MYRVVIRDYRTPDGHNEWVVYDGPRHSQEVLPEIPYHRRASGYNDTEGRWSHPPATWADPGEAYHFMEETNYFDEWLSYSEEDRRTIRRNTINTFNQETASLMNHALTQVRKEIFVTFPQSQTMTVVAQNTTNTKEDGNMNTEFHTERAALERDMHKTHIHASDHLVRKHNMTPAHPVTIREALKYIADGKYDKLSDNELDAKHRWDNPLMFLTFRDAPMDEEGHNKAKTALDEDFRATSLKAKVLDPEKALKEVESFRNRHTVH